MLPIRTSLREGLAQPMRTGLLALVLAPLAACATDPAGPAQPLQALPRELTAPERSVVGSSNRFAFDLLREVNADEPTENVFISPLSVSMALGMTMNGAVGVTHEEMQAALRFDGLTQPQINEAYRGLIDMILNLDPTVDMGLANSVWFREGFPFDRPFFDTVEDAFDAEVEGLDFADPASVGRINGWVDAATRGKIPTILEQIPSDAVMYLINAIYFKGSWREQFDPNATRPALFNGLGGESATVPMMSGSTTVRAGRTPEYQVIDMPYGNGAFSMTILLPGGGRDVNDVIAALDDAGWDSLVAGLGRPSKLPVVMPRFRLEYEKSLNNTLSALGMPTAFTDLADFSGMSASAGRDLSITDVRHKSFVEVNEEGTEAAAVTSVEVSVTSMPVEFRVDRPFLFVIREQFTGTILFMGKIVMPESD